LCMDAQHSWDGREDILREGETRGGRGLTYDLRFSGVIANREVPTEKLPITTQKKEKGKKGSEKTEGTKKN
jgi:hypothetical protein